ncbi:MAG: UvrABC system protein B [Candidatus Shapirobacteria bacterium GW2011_GWF2_37_20]|nr:MAG: UvrABC system protein B [Candidatus Shapirobacteria bacterium GW2011_GWF2_37_20]
MPEVSLVAILDAASQGFLRSRSSLIQIMGRASRHVEGKVILYADSVSLAMEQAIKEVNRRRLIQIQYNTDHNITPQTIIKSIRPRLIEANVKNLVITPLLEIDPSSLTPNQRKSHISKLKKEMRTYATDLDFESAIKLRDKIKEIENL